MNIFKRFYLKARGVFSPRDSDTEGAADGSGGKAVQAVTDISPGGSLAEWLGLKGRRGNPTAEITYFTCLKMLGETIGKMPIKCYQATDKGIIVPKPDAVSRLLRDRPNEFMTPTVFWTAVENNRNHYGNAYVYIRREFIRERYGGNLIPKDLWIMPSDNVKVLIDDAGVFNGEGKLWYWYIDKYSGRDHLFSSDEVMHFKSWFSFDGIMGQPVQVILRETIGAAIESQHLIANLYEKGLTAKAALEYTGELAPGQIQKLRERFEEYANGTLNAGRIMPIPLGMKLTPLNIKLTDAQFYELKKYNALQIAGAFGIKPNQINDYEKSSYNSSEMQNLTFYVDTVQHPLKQYEEEIAYKLLSDRQRDEGIYYKFNEKVLLRTDSKTQMDIFGVGVNNGIYMPNEVRRKLDMPDAEGGDRLMMNGNYIPITDVGKQYGA